MAKSAAEFRRQSRKIITLPSGGEIEIRKVLQGEVTSAVGVPPIFIALQRDKEMLGEEVVNERLQEDEHEFAELVKESASNNRATQRAVIAYGVVNPKVVLGDVDHEDEMLPEDFGEDYDFVYNEIVKFSTLKYQLLGAVGEANFQKDSAAALPDGGEVRVSPE